MLWGLSSVTCPVCARGVAGRHGLRSCGSALHAMRVDSVHKHAKTLRVGASASSRWAGSIDSAHMHVPTSAPKLDASWVTLTIIINKATFDKTRTLLDLERLLTP